MPFRILRSVAWIAVVFAGAFLILSALYARSIEWNSMRLAVTAAVAAGQPIYPGTDSGVVTGHIYPPVAAWIFLPALLAPTLGSEIFAATLISAALVIGPLLLLCHLARREGADPLAATLAATAAALVVFLDPGLRYVAVMVHADGPAIGFGGLALLGIACASDTRDRRWIFVGAAGAVACACKQTLVPTAALVFAAAFFRHGLGAFGRVVLGAALVSTAVFGWLAVTGQLGAFFYNTVEIPRRHPWVTEGYAYAWGQPAGGQSAAERLRALVDVFIPLLQRFWPAFAAATFALFRLRRAGSALDRFAGLAGLTVWLQLPLLLASSVKLGGDVNNQAPSPWFALAATLALGLAHVRRFHDSAAARTALAAAVAVLLAANLPRFAFLTTAALRPNTPVEAMTAYLRAHPGTVYLPWNPLLTLRAEGRRDHFEYGVFDRALAGRPITPAHFRAHLPPKLAHLALRADQPPSAYETYRRYLALRPVTSTVPGWLFFATDPAESTR